MVKSRKKLTLLKSSKKNIALILALLLVGFGFWYAFLRSSETPVKQPSVQDVDNSSINLAPPTEEEKKAGETQTEAAVRQNTPPPPTASGKKQVVPIITHAGSDSINAYIPGILEDGGICTATITKISTSQKVVKTSQGFVNVSYTTCSQIEATLSQGRWSVVVSYNSGASEGSSSPKEFEVE